MTLPPKPPGLSLRQAVRPAVFAHDLMAGNREGAARLAAECEELLQLTRELLHATGRAALLGTDPGGLGGRSPLTPGGSPGGVGGRSLLTERTLSPPRASTAHNGSGNPSHSDPDHDIADPGTSGIPAQGREVSVMDFRSVKDFPHDSPKDPSQSSNPSLKATLDISPGGRNVCPNREMSDLGSSRGGVPGGGAVGERALGGGVPGKRALGGGVPGEERLLDAYADAAMAWAKVAGCLLALGGTLLDQGEWAAVRRLADVLADTGEDGLARDLRLRLGAAVFGAYREPLRRIGNAMPPAEIARGIDVLRAVLREVPQDFPDRDREVNRLLAPLAASVHKVMKARGIDAGFDSRVEHIASGGVAGYPEIVTTSLDELAAEFEGLYR